MSIIFFVYDILRNIDLGSMILARLHHCLVKDREKQL